MPLTDIDRNLLLRCLGRKPKAWEDFIDRYMGLVIHAVTHTAENRGISLSQDDVDDLCAEVFLAIVQNDFAVLRHFRGQSSLPTYLTVVARRICVRELLRRQAGSAQQQPAQQPVDNQTSVEQRIADQEQVEKLMQSLSAPEAQVVRMYHLEGKTYHEISQSVGMPENSIGPTLSRAREKMRTLNLA